MPYAPTQHTAYICICQRACICHACVYTYATCRNALGCGVMGGELYVIGGEGDDFMLRLRGKTWANIMKINQPQRHSVMHSTPECIYVIGGMKGKDTAVANCWKYVCW